MSMKTVTHLATVEVNHDVGLRQGEVVELDQVVDTARHVSARRVRPWCQVYSG